MNIKKYIFTISTLLLVSLANLPIFGSKREQFGYDHDFDEIQSKLSLKNELKSLKEIQPQYQPQMQGMRHPRGYQQQAESVETLPQPIQRMLDRQAGDPNSAVSLSLRDASFPKGNRGTLEFLTYYKILDEIKPLIQIGTRIQSKTLNTLKISINRANQKGDPSELIGSFFSLSKSLSGKEEKGKKEDYGMEQVNLDTEDKIQVPLFTLQDVAEIEQELRDTVNGFGNPFEKENEQVPDADKFNAAKVAANAAIDRAKAGGKVVYLKSTSYISGGIVGGLKKVDQTDIGNTQDDEAIIESLNRLYELMEGISSKSGSSESETDDSEVGGDEQSPANAFLAKLWLFQNLHAQPVQQGRQRLLSISAPSGAPPTYVALTQNDVTLLTGGIDKAMNAAFEQTSPEFRKQLADHYKNNTSPPVSAPTIDDRKRTIENEITNMSIDDACNNILKGDFKQNPILQEHQLQQYKNKLNDYKNTDAYLGYTRYAYSITSWWNDDAATSLEMTKRVDEALLKIELYEETLPVKLELHAKNERYQESMCRAAVDIKSELQNSGSLSQEEIKQLLAPITHVYSKEALKGEYELQKKGIGDNTKKSSFFTPTKIISLGVISAVGIHLYKKLTQNDDEDGESSESDADQNEEQSDEDEDEEDEE